MRHISVVVKEIVMNMCLATPCREEFRARVALSVESGLFEKSEAEHVLNEFDREEEWLDL